MKFLDVKTDYAFKRVFGASGSQPILTSFLNAILEYEGDHAITDLTIVDPYQVPVIQGMKDTFVDVKATLANGKSVIIEMQVLNVKGFEQRILYNAAKHYASQLKQGEDYTLLNPVIALTFTDFVLFDDHAHHLSRFRLMERDRLVKYSDDVELIFVELPKFTGTLETLKTIQDKWLYFIKNAGRMDYIPETLSDPRIKDAFDRANEAALSAEELETQHKRHDFIVMQRGALELAEAKGKSIGLEEGVEKGKLTVARNLLALMDDAGIARATGLALERVRDLRRES